MWVAYREIKAREQVAHDERKFIVFEHCRANIPRYAMAMFAGMPMMQQISV